MPKGKCPDCRIVYEWRGAFPLVKNATCPVHGTLLRRTTIELRGFQIVAANPVTDSEKIRMLLLNRTQASLGR